MARLQMEIYTLPYLADEGKILMAAKWFLKYKKYHIICAKVTESFPKGRQNYRIISKAV